MMTKIMPYLWRWNNWIDKKVTHIKAWFTAAIDGEWDDDLDDDIIEKMWKERCRYGKVHTESLGEPSLPMEDSRE